jgi:hypothetical protein
MGVSGVTSGRRHRVGIVGTFDIENYGDLLFPLLAQAELAARLGDVEVVPFSYAARDAADWPYRVEPLSELARLAPDLDALLIGGGYLIRFDAEVAPGYGPVPGSGIHHPTGYWLGPALLALAQGLPVVWSAPGMHCNELPPWSHELLRIALEGSDVAGVRDGLTMEALAAIAPGAAIEVVPDTGFGVARLIDGVGGELAAGPYVLVQAAAASVPFATASAAADDRDQLSFVVVPVSPAVGDDAELLGALGGTPKPWTHPLEVARLVAGADAVVGHSYHLAITALAHGVPFFRTLAFDTGKYTALDAFDGILPAPTGPDAVAVLLRERGRRTPSPSLADALDALDRHWDGVAAVVERGRRAPTAAASGLLQRAVASAEAVDGSAGARARMAALELEVASGARFVGGLEREIVVRGARIAELEAQLHGTEPPILDVGSILRATGHEVPFQWAEIDGLFAADDAARLTSSYPTEGFSRIAGYGGEKDYEYDARELVPMGSDRTSAAESLDPAWLALATSLRSEPYRLALSLLTGVDLADAALEVNVFHYGPGSSLGPHRDLPDKILTHVLYFNETWDLADGGTLAILRSEDIDDGAADVLPVIGRSAVLVRSEASWHAVRPVVAGVATSRRSVTATFHRPGSVSSMWPVTSEARSEDRA